VAEAQHAHIRIRIRILIADDQEIIRQGLAIILDHQDDMTVIGQAHDGEQAVQMARTLQPDVILMDIKMPRVNGIQATRTITSETRSQVIILTTYDSDDWVFDGVRAGAQAYLLKDASPDELTAAIRGVHRGESQLDPAIARKVMDEFRRMSSPTATSTETHPSTGSEGASLPANQLPVESLTEREMDVLSLVAQGLSNRDIASALYLSEGTVKNYVSTIMAKFHANDRTQVVVRALKEGIVKL
jgi:DNA-binding NarL/FixJ family response regulator